MLFARKWIENFHLRFSFAASSCFTWCTRTEVDWNTFSILERIFTRFSLACLSFLSCWSVAKDHKHLIRTTVNRILLLSHWFIVRATISKRGNESDGILFLLPFRCCEELSCWVSAGFSPKLCTQSFLLTPGKHRHSLVNRKRWFAHDKSDFLPTQWLVKRRFPCSFHSRSVKHFLSLTKFNILFDGVRQQLETANRKLSSSLHSKNNENWSNIVQRFNVQQLFLLRYVCLLLGRENCDGKEKVRREQENFCLHFFHVFLGSFYS